MEEILVSIVIPTYKRGWEYLFRAIDSVRKQSHKRLEIIVVDDSPESFELRQEIISNMADLCETDSRVKYIVNPTNIGGALARNRGIEQSNGEYIAFLDDDDEYLENKIKEQLEFMIKEDCDLSFENMIMYNLDGEIVDVREHPGIERFDNEYLRAFHLMYHLTGTPTFMFKAEALKKIGGFDDAKMGQEFYLMLKAIESGLKIRYNPICNLKIYKHSDGGVSQGKNKIYGEKALYEFKKKYYCHLTKVQCQQVDFRHYAVMVVAYLRNKMFIKAGIAAISAFFVSPKIFFKEVTNHFRKIFIAKRGAK